MYVFYSCFFSSYQVSPLATYIILFHHIIIHHSLSAVLVVRQVIATRNNSNKMRHPSPTSMIFLSTTLLDSCIPYIPDFLRWLLVVHRRDQLRYALSSWELWNDWWMTHGLMANKQRGTGRRRGEKEKKMDDLFEGNTLNFWKSVACIQDSFCIQHAPFTFQNYREWKLKTPRRPPLLFQIKRHPCTSSHHRYHT